MFTIQYSFIAFHKIHFWLCVVYILQMYVLSRMLCVCKGGSVQKRLALLQFDIQFIAFGF
jgi:hypothetical protein